MDSHSNVYYKPEDYGLEIIAELSSRDLLYEYDMVVVWRDKDNNVYMAHDSGCSCPSPFEDVKFEDLQKVHTMVDVYRFVEQAGKIDSYHVFHFSDVNLFLSRVRPFIEGEYTEVND